MSSLLLIEGAWHNNFPLICGPNHRVRAQVGPIGTLAIDINGNLLFNSPNIDGVSVQGGQGEFTIDLGAVGGVFAVHGGVATPVTSSGDPVSVGVTIISSKILTVNLLGNNGDPFLTGVFVLVFL